MADVTLGVVMEAAERAARKVGHEYVGPEHVLLGIADESLGVAWEAIAAIGLTPHDLWQQFSQLVLPGREPLPSGRLPLKPWCTRLVDSVRRWARHEGRKPTSADILVLLLDDDPQTIACCTLVMLGVEQSELQAEVRRRGE